MLRPFEKKKAIGFLIAFLVLSVVFVAQARSELLLIKKYLSTNGLVYDKVYNIYQDSSGFIRFTTPIGMSLGGSYEIESETGAGTSVNLNVPVSK